MLQRICSCFGYRVPSLLQLRLLISGKHSLSTGFVVTSAVFTLGFIDNALPAFFFFSLPVADVWNETSTFKSRQLIPSSQMWREGVWGSEPFKARPLFTLTRLFATKFIRSRITEGNWCFNSGKWLRSSLRCLLIAHCLITALSNGESHYITVRGCMAV